MSTTASTALKRPRAPSSSSLSTSIDSLYPPHKASRPGSETKYEDAYRPQLLCNLPPTCHRHPTPLANTNELERHYATYHAYVCGESDCGCVFTDARLLELHQTECHDPIAAIRKDRGEKIFQCHIPAPTCGRDFHTPKARRLHLIQVHGYPKQYFFAVTNKGIGGLLKKWGEGASMIRKEWTPRENGKDNVNHRSDERIDNDEDGENGDENDNIDDDQDGNRQEESEEEYADLEATPRMLPRTTGIHSPQSSISSSSKSSNKKLFNNNDDNNTDIAGLTNSLTSLSLVPSSVRFGRGAKTRGFAPVGFRGRGRGTIGVDVGADTSRGRGPRGRGGRSRINPNARGGRRGRGS